MEGSVRDRFRLIYLKSTESEKSNLNRPEPSSPSNEKNTTASSMYGIPATFSSQTQFEQAISDLKHPDPKIRKLAIQYLEKGAPAAAIPHLQETLSDQNPDVRAQAILTLIKLKDPDMHRLLKKYLRDSSSMVKIAALRGIFQSREGADLNLLLQLLSDDSPQVRRKMATLLGWSQMEGVLPILAELSKDPDAKVRKAALFSLITLYPDESEDRLIKAMADPEPRLRKWAKRVLEKRIEKPVTVEGESGPSSKKTGRLGNPNL